MKFRGGLPRAARARGGIEFRHLTFSYPGSRRPALRDVTFTVPAGRTVAIVGRTGAGKSTLLALLPRLFEPPPGSVFLDGRDVRTLELGTQCADSHPANRMIYTGPSEPRQPLDHPSLVKTAQILSERANRLGVSEPDVAIEGQNQIRLRLAGIPEAN